MLRKLTSSVTAASALMFMLCTACSDDDISYADDNYGNFDALSEIIDTRYCFLQEKDIDWRQTSASYRALITDETNEYQLFQICASMLDCLEDGHVNLVSRFTTSYYRKWWTDYPQDFDLRTLQQDYLDFRYLSTSGMYYYLFPENVGYIYYPSFSTTVSELGLDYVLAALSDSKALIIDIRDNGGGVLTNIDTFVGRFIDHEIPGGSICHKTGPGHDDFSEPYFFTYKPAPDYRVKYLDKPIVLLTNRSCYSAANAFAAVMKSLPNVTLIGARTGGGGGLPWTSELPNGWSIRFSASPLYGPDGELTEFGIDPTEGFECHSPADELAAGYDNILSRAIEYLAAFPDPK